MYTETLRKKNPSLKLFFAVIGFAFAIMLMPLLFNAAQAYFSAVYIQYAVYIAMIVVCYLIVKRQMTDYRYTIGDSELIFERVVGRSERKLEVVGFEEIEQAGYEGDSPVTLRATFHSAQGYRISYRRGGKSLVVSLHPSEQYVNTLQLKLERYRGAAAADGGSRREDGSSD